MNVWKSGFKLSGTEPAIRSKLLRIASNDGVEPADTPAAEIALAISAQSDAENVAVPPSDGEPEVVVGFGLG